MKMFHGFLYVYQRVYDLQLVASASHGANDALQDVLGAQVTVSCMPTSQRPKSWGFSCPQIEASINKGTSHSWMVYDGNSCWNIWNRWFKSSISTGVSIINHPWMGVLRSMETSKSSLLVGDVPRYNQSTNNKLGIPHDYGSSQKKRNETPAYRGHSVASVIVWTQGTDGKPMIHGWIITFLYLYPFNIMI